MSKKLFLIIIFTATSVLNVSLDKKTVDQHLDTYAKYNKTLHDNIDDNVETHTHTHRHGDNEEEHEHHHDHELTVTQVDTFLLEENDEIEMPIALIDLKQGQVVKNLISNAHPSEILRPPIC